MFEIETKTGDTIAKLAHRHLGSVSAFREIAELNDINPLDGIVPGGKLKIPTRDEALKLLEPQLTQVAAAANGGLDRLQSALKDAVSDVAGYSKVAQNALAKANGVLGQVESVLGNNSASELLRKYSGEYVRLVDWLLAGTNEAENKISGAKSLIDKAIRSIDL